MGALSVHRRQGATLELAQRELDQRVRTTLSRGSRITRVGSPGTELEFAL